MNVQLIEKDGVPEWAVLPYETYELLLHDHEMLTDIQAFDAAKASLTAVDELFPSSLITALLAGHNPIRVWRQYRQLQQQQLADLAGISKAYLSQLEAGKRRGSTAVLQRLAQALNLDLEDLVAWSTPRPSP